jgi:hypothetical protein
VLTTCVLVDVGLGGELRAGKRLEERVREARKMGFERIIVPRSPGGRAQASSARAGGSSGSAGGEHVVQCRTLFDVVQAAFVNPEVARSFTNRRARKNAAPKRWAKQGSSGEDQNEDADFDAECVDDGAV